MLKVLKALRLLSDDGGLSMTTALLYVSLALIGFYGLSRETIVFLFLALLSFHIQKLFDLQRARTLSEADKNAVESLSDRLSKLEAILSMAERRMF